MHYSLVQKAIAKAQNVFVKVQFTAHNDTMYLGVTKKEALTLCDRSALINVPMIAEVSPDGHTVFIG